MKMNKQNSADPEAEFDAREAGDHDWPFDQEPLIEVSYEELEEQQREARHVRELERGIDTAHTEGSTDDPLLAQRQGLVYIPPSDPPVLPSDDGQNVAIAAGFASSMEETDPSVVRLPDHVDGNDLDLEQDIRTMLHNNSETAHLTHVKLAVRNGIVFLTGSVQSEDDIAILDEMIRDMEDIVDVRSRLTVAE